MKLWGELTLTPQSHTVLLCLYAADPANFPASNNVLVTLISSEFILFTWLGKRKTFLCLLCYLINMVMVTWQILQNDIVLL